MVLIWAALFMLTATGQDTGFNGVRMHNGRPTIFIDGKPKAVPTFSPCAWSKPAFEKGVPPFGRHRMGAYFLAVPSVRDTGHGWSPTAFWLDDRVSQGELLSENLNRPTLAEQVAFHQQNDPGAYYFIRNGPSDAPLSWKKKNPDQLFVDETGKRLMKASLASDLFWSNLAQACKAGVTYCEKQPWSARILGYWFGMDNEGTYVPVMDYRLYDHSDVMLNKWRAFLRAKYKTDAALQNAHGNEDIALATVTAPKDPLLGADAAEELYWQPAQQNQARRDYLELVTQLTHDGYRQIITEMHEALNGRERLLVYDAFKQSMLGWNLRSFFVMDHSQRLQYPELMAGSGHLRMAELLEMPQLGGVITPHDYQARGLGGIYEPEGIVDSVVLRGKYFLCEMDTRTYVQTNSDRYGLARNPKEFAAITWRNLATSWTRGFNSYYMDLYTPWFADDRIQEVIGRQVAAMKDSVNWEHETVPGIAMILDDTAILETNGSGHVYNEAILWELKTGLGRCGVPYRVYLFDDLRLDNFPEHRVYYFPNLYRVDDDRLALLREKVFRDGKVVVWGPGAGISDGNSLSPLPRRKGVPPQKGKPSPERLTGFRYHPLIPANYPRRTLIANHEHPLTRGLPADTVIGGPLPYGPLLFPADGTVLGLAWTKQGRNLTGLAVKEFGRGATGNAPLGDRQAGDWASVVTTAVPLPAGLWRNLARYAGAHVYAETNDVLLADSSVVGLHSVDSGFKSIRLPTVRSVTNLVTGEPYANRTRRIEFQLDAPATAVFLLEPPIVKHKAKGTADMTEKDKGPLPRTRRRLAEKQDIRILLYGDSISEVGRSKTWHGGASKPEHNWGAVLTRKLAETYPDSDFSVRHFGIGGQNSYEGLGRLDQVADFDVDLVLVAFGANDCGHHPLQPKQTGLAIKNLAKGLRERFKLDVIVVGSGGDNPKAPIYQHIDETLAATRKAAKAAGVPYVDIRTPILNATDNGAKWADYHLAKENTHPNDRGHDIWAETVLNEIKRVLTE